LSKYVILALGNLGPQLGQRTEYVINLLVEKLKDPKLSKYAVLSLGKLGPQLGRRNR
jgi:hypothetical protein